MQLDAWPVDCGRVVPRDRGEMQRNQIFSRNFLFAVLARAAVLGGGDAAWSEII
jgi:hypothetical protein